MNRNDQDTIELPKYQSDKSVIHALKIKRITVLFSDSSAEMIPEDENYAPLNVDVDFVNKHNPKAGGYYVVYEDGFKGWLSAASLRAFYTRI